MAAVRIVTAALAAVWAALFSVILRAVGCRTLDATPSTMDAGSSASAIFWLVIPETYSFASITILLALLTAALQPSRTLSVF